MEWYNILSVIVGALGGTAGLISIYKARPEKTKLEIENMQSMLDEAHKMYDEMKEEKESVSKEFSDYKAENMKYVAEFKERFAKVETRLDSAEEETRHLKSVILQGYRCKFPDNIEDCPVIREYENKHCKRCNIDGNGTKGTI